MIVPMLIVGCAQFTPENTAPEAAFQGNNTLKIAAWNLQIFGQTKASDVALMGEYSKVMNQYDIVFVQEIRDASGTAFPKLCLMMPGYACVISTPAGRSSSKEQYGVFYKGVEMIGVEDYNIQEMPEFERPPYRAIFKRGDYDFSVIVEHIKPDDAASEIDALERLADRVEGRVLVLGDLNADCAYYKEKVDFDPPWVWAIKSTADTTTGATDCAYDRMIFNERFSKDVVESGVFTDGIDGIVSDHFPVWATISTT